MSSLVWCLPCGGPHVLPMHSLKLEPPAFRCETVPYSRFGIKVGDRRETAADEARTDLTGLRRSIARRGPGLANLCRLPVGRNALLENPVHITLGGDASASKTPNAR